MRVEVEQTSGGPLRCTRGCVCFLLEGKRKGAVRGRIYVAPEPLYEASETALKNQGVRGNSMGSVEKSIRT